VRKGASAVALPMLVRKVNDGEFTVRFVVMGWRQTQTAEALAALLKMMQFDRDPNVPAEAPNSLSMFGAAFRGDDNLLVRHSSWLRCTIAATPN
jgi:hypothetical protein